MLDYGGGLSVGTSKRRCTDFVPIVGVAGTATLWFDSRRVGQAGTPRLARQTVFVACD
jgi:hypothetical protein